MTDTHQGVIRGKIVELASDPGLEEGQRVEVVLRPVAFESQPMCSAAGLLSNVPGLDESLEEIQHYRKQAQYRTDPL